MFLVVLGPEIIDIVHECTSGLKLSLRVPPILDLPLFVLTAPPPTMSSMRYLSYSTRNSWSV